MFTFFPFIALLLWLINCPAFEKILSAGTDVAISPRCFFAALLREGNVCSFIFHQRSGSLSYGIALSSEYCRISIMTSVPAVRCCWDARIWQSNSIHISPSAAGGNGGAPAGDREVVAGAIAETELVAELVLGPGADTEWAEVWITDCISMMSPFFSPIQHFSCPGTQSFKSWVQVGADTKTRKCFNTSEMVHTLCWQRSS